MKPGFILIAMTAIFLFATNGGVASHDAAAQQEPMPVDAEISWLYEVTITPGKLDDLHALIAEMASHAEANEPGTLTYHWTISQDGTIGHIHERYANAEAALAHLASYNSQFAARLTPLVSSARMFVNGDPGAEVRQQIAGAQPIYMEDAGGFARDTQ